MSRRLVPSMSKWERRMPQVQRPQSRAGVRALARRLTLAAAAFAALAASLAPRPLAAATLDPSYFPAARAAGPGQRVKAPDLASEAELIRFDDELLPALLRVRPGERVRIADWPVAPGARRDVLIARHEIYAPGARVLRVDAAGVHELPRSRLVFFWGTVADDPISGIYVAVDPATGTIEALAQTAAGGQHQLRPLAPGKPGLHLLATPEAFLAGQGAKAHPEWACGEDQLPPGSAGIPGLHDPAVDSHSAGEPPPQRMLADPAAPLRLPQAAAERSGPPVTASGIQSYDLATVAIDTDHEFMSLKFSEDTTAATNYIASLFAQINVMYKRDLQVRLQVGNVILRTASVADPYTQQPSSNGAADFNELQEFSNYWAANEGGVTRTVTTMLSGKSPSPNFASGIAWVAGLCSTSIGYNFCQVFQIDYLAGDALIVGHEIGHNFGSRHTHCYSPPIDQCFNLEAGCYSGPTSCPAPSTVNGVPNVYGTIMSYCHLLGGCSTEMVFHPRTVAVINPNIAAALGVCMTPPPPPSVTGISPNNGPAAGGTPVVLSGANFQSGDTVTIGGVPATGVSVTGPGTITAVTGAHATGLVDVVVNDANGTGTLGHGFFYSPPPATTRFYTVTPCRVLDTRQANGPLGGPGLAAGQARTFTIAGTCGIPSSAVAVSANLTAIAASTGSVALYPGNALPLGTSNVSFAAGQVLACNSILLLATDGTGTVGAQNASPSTIQFVLDVNGYFQ
jgi:hypothetical protein